MKKIFASLALLLPALTWAHPGHGGTDGYTIIHYFSEPQHAIITLGSLALVTMYIIRERRKSKS
ncbi:MAG: hypothetical protein WCH78_03970 [Bacteroidota bacterium]